MAAPQLPPLILQHEASTPADLLGGAGDEAGRAAATALMADAFGAGRRVFVATDSGVWAASAGRTDWLPLERVRTHPLVPVGAVTSVVGVGATVGFGALAVLSRGNAEAAVDAAFQSSGTAAFDAASADYEAASGAYRLATMALIPSGIVLAGGGALLKNQDVLLRDETGLPVMVCDDPMCAVARGIGDTLDKLDLLHTIAVS